MSIETNSCRLLVLELTGVRHGCFYSLALPSHVARPFGSEEWPSCCPDALRVWEPTCRTWIPSLQFRWQYTTTAYCTTNEARADSAGGCCKKNAGEWLFYWYDMMTGSWPYWQVQNLVVCAVFGSNWFISEKCIWWKDFKVFLLFSCMLIICFKHHAHLNSSSGYYLQFGLQLLFMLRHWCEHLWWFNYDIFVLLFD